MLLSRLKWNFLFNHALLFKFQNKNNGCSQKFFYLQVSGGVGPGRGGKDGMPKCPFKRSWSCTCCSAPFHSLIKRTEWLTVLSRDPDLAPAALLLSTL
jgi:hypothetical protein